MHLQNVNDDNNCSSNDNDKVHHPALTKLNQNDKRLLYTLRMLGLETLFTNFNINMINFNDLFLLTKEDLIEMNIPIGPRNRILNFAMMYKKHTRKYDMNELIEFFNEHINLKDIAKDAARCAITMLDAEECPSGEMPVIIDNGFGGVIFHEACGHGLEASSVSKNLSIFSGKKGKKVASDIVNAYDDGTIDGAWGSGNFDDEGNKTQRTQLIKNGVLVNYLVDNFNGRAMNEKGNGACRRESYKHQPTSRMSNTFIGNGTSTKQEIIEATKFGLYAKSLGGGSVNPATGDFNFAVNEGYLVENGKITKPVKGATLIGNGASILFNIDMIANNLLRDQGMCGASSGSIPADVGQPTIRVKSILVGGTGGKIK